MTGSGAGPVADRVARLLDSPVVSWRPVAGGDICRSWRARLAGADVFVKQTPPDAPRMAVVEAAGLRWLGEGGAAVPTVLAVDADLLVLTWCETAAPTPRAARAAGRMLAALHASGAPAFGSPPPGPAGTGWIGSAPLTYGRYEQWPEFYAQERLTPYLDEASRRGRIDGPDRDAVAAVRDQVDRFAGPPVAPARLHGDLWAGNVLWTAEGAVLIDPAAHGGHPETDLAMLHLFAPPLLPDLVAGLASAAPLLPGWRRRLPLHQLHPLLVHAVLFGGGYGRAAGEAARRLLADGV